MLTLSSTVVVTPDQASADMAGETVMLNLTSGEYYGLNATGAFVWRAIQQPQVVRSVRDAMLRKYDISVEQCECDLMAVLDAMVKAGLATVLDLPGHDARPSGRT